MKPSFFYTIEFVHPADFDSPVPAEPVVYSAESQSVVPAVVPVVVSAVEDLIAAAYFCANRAYLPIDSCGEKNTLRLYERRATNVISPHLKCGYCGAVMILSRIIPLTAGFKRSSRCRFFLDSESTTSFKGQSQDGFSTLKL